MPKPPPPKRRPTPAPVTAASVSNIDLEPIESSRSNNHAESPRVLGIKAQKAAELEEIEIENSVKGLNLDAVSSTIASTQTEVQRSLASLSAKLVERVQQFENVEKMIVLKRQKLAEMYDIEVAAETLDDLNAQIDRQREAWTTEQELKAREFDEQRRERKKHWDREEEEYRYGRDQERKKTADAFAYEMAEQKRKNKDQQELLEKNWGEREAELKKREAELADLRAQVASFPEQLKKAENAAGIVAGNSIKKEYETKMVLASKDAETEKRLATQEIAALKQTIDKLTGSYAELKAQLEQAHRDMKEISAKALESASNRSTTEALQRILEKDQSAKPTK